jgi:tetratricopeptide (TPR) repeat protein
MTTEERDELLETANEAYTMGQLNRALELYESLLTVAPDSAWAHSRIGAILAQRGHLEEAEASFERALAIDPQLAQAHSNLGNLYYGRGEYEQALVKYKEAVALLPENPVFHENLHAAYKKLGKVGDAVSALKKAHRLGRQNTKMQAQTKWANARGAVKGRFGCVLPAVLLFVIISAGLLI